MTRVGTDEIQAAKAVSGRVDIAAAVNDHAVLDRCLNRSPSIVSGDAKLRIYEGYPTAGAAYAQALADSDAPYLVLAHQDIYLPLGFIANLQTQVEELERLDPNWAVAGPIGADAVGNVLGQTWSSGLGQVVGTKTWRPVVVEALDEMLLVVRRAAGVTFDQRLPSFHLYGADVIQTAKTRGLRSYVIDLPAIHHSRPVVDLRGGFQVAYRYMQRKWRKALPLQNLILPIYPTMIPLWILSVKMLLRARGNTTRREPEGDPAEIARRLGLEPATKP